MDRRRRFTDQCSEIVWAAIRTLDESLQHQLRRKWDTELATSVENPTTAGDRVLAAVHALKVVADVLDHSPSVKDYRAVRNALPELSLPPDGTVRRWLAADWNTCLRRWFLDAVDDGDFASHPIGFSDRFEDEEVLAALRACANELGHAPTITEYFQWARRPDVREGPEPCSHPSCDVLTMGNFCLEHERATQALRKGDGWSRSTRFLTARRTASPIKIAPASFSVLFARLRGPPRWSRRR